MIYARSWLVLSVGALIFSLTSCREKDKTLRFVLPDGFQGHFVIVEDPSGLKIDASNPDIVITVPGSRVLQVQSFDFKHDWRHYSVSFKNGDVIPYSMPLDTEVAMRGGGIAERDGIERVEYFVGTLKDFEEFSFDEVKIHTP